MIKGAKLEQPNDANIRYSLSASSLQKNYNGSKYFCFEEKVPIIQLKSDIRNVDFTNNNLIPKNNRELGDMSNDYGNQNLSSDRYDKFDKYFY